MTFRYLTYVIAIVEENSFTKAANRLFISQSALSQAIIKLEKEMNLQLFIRKNTTIEPTDACYVLYQDGKHILNQWNLLENKLKHMTIKETSNLRIGMPTLLIQSLLPHITPAFNKLFPDIAVEVIEDTSDAIESMVNEHIIDFGCVQTPLGNLSLNSKCLFEDCILLAIPRDHPFNDKHNIIAGNDDFPMANLSELKDEQFLTLRNKRCNTMFKELFEEFNFKPNILREFTRWNVLHDYVEQGAAIGFAKGHCVAHKRSNKICYYYINSPNAIKRYVAVYATKVGLSSIAIKYIDIIRKYASTLPGVICKV